MPNVRVKGLRFRQGSREVYALAPTIAQMLSIIPERVSPDVIQDANRRLYIPHGRGFAEYVLDEPNWLTGTLMAGVAASAVEWDEKTCMATLDLDRKDEIRLFDGQHRRYGIAYAVQRVQREIDNLQTRLDASSDPGQVREEIAAQQAWVEDLLSQSIPLLLYVESDTEALQQMYADISHVRVPDPITVSRFDKRDPYNGAALELAETHPALKGLVEMEYTTLPRASAKLMTLNQLSSLLRVLFASLGGRPTKAAQSVTGRMVVERGRQYFDDMMRASDALRAVASGDLTTTDLRKRGELMVNITIQKVMAAAWQELVIVRGMSRAEVAEYFRSLPHTPQENRESLWVAAGVLPATTEHSTPVGRTQELKRAIRSIVEGAAMLAA